MKRRLYRSTSDRQLAGVCGGLANCFGLDPTIVRLLFVFLALAGMPGVLIYLVMAVLVPTDPRKISIVDDAATAQG